MEAYKNRKIDTSIPVEVYRCLNRGHGEERVWSIRQNGKVVAHSQHIVLKQCKFVVNEGGKVRSRRTRQRNVHAFIRGMLGDISDIKMSFSFLLRYDPFSERGFYGDGVGEVTKASMVYSQGGHLLFQL